MGLSIGCGEKESDSGEAAGTPDIDVSPLELDFGAVQPDESALAAVQVANRGDGVLEVPLLTVEIQAGSAGSFTFDELARVPFVLAPGETVPLSLICRQDASPTQLIGLLRIVSNDPDEEEVQVDLRCSAAEDEGG